MQGVVLMKVPPLALSFVVAFSCVAVDLTAQSRRTPDGRPDYEYACHESNYSLANVLKGRRFAETSQPPAKN